ncbi:DUF1861 family protein [Pullulanibacillus sp. KACC 23026]|uniref:MTP-1 family protein n=1 Tax=Pullulanibacillus sp. KACC 23026 TaxID=3028315 RepID=UPI0023AFC8A8|nr:DUF1861 family protein [Pullulanibacillus sp. KACC 23026]WEG13374.1 DUF1861 family protein [Pullulanibacillus sp. KACC 23026]
MEANHIKTCDELLKDYLSNNEFPQNPEKLVFAGVGDRDVYNITAPFEDDGEIVIAGRVESRDSEQSEVYFFINQSNVWVPKSNAPVLPLQDPFVTKIAGQLIIGGVQTFPHSSIEGALGWRTVFYKGDNLTGLKEFAKGPDGMKDLRLIQLSDGTIGVFTRPQGDKGGRGKIGFTRLASLDDLTIDAINNAPLLDNQFTDEEWGGANELHLLKNGSVGVLGHIACFDDEGNRHYYPMTFVLDPETGRHTPLRLLTTRSHFLPGEAKRMDLIDVVFSGGLIRKADGNAEFYAGISDAEAQKITVKDPFLKFEV